MELDEQEIIRRFKDGDNAAFEDLVLKYQDRIFSLCLYMLANKQEAEDAAQDAFLKAYRGLKDFRPDASLYTWLYRIGVNTCIDYKRKPIFASLFSRSDTGEEIDLDLASALPSPEKEQESKQIRLALIRALRKLSPKLRAVIILKEVEGLSYEEIAESLDLSLGTVKSRISRAREELRKSLKDFREQK